MSSSWAMFPVVNRQGGLNIVDRVELQSSLIRTFLLLRAGEHPFYPNIGIPDVIFRPTSEIDLEAFAQIVENQLQEYIDLFKLEVNNLKVIARASKNPETFILDIYYRVLSQEQRLAVDYLKLRPS